MPASTLEQYVGKKFGRLTILRIADTNIRKYRAVVCRCDCGKEKSLPGAHVLNGYVRSCGCLRITRRTDFKVKRAQMIRARMAVQGGARGSSQALRRLESLFDAFKSIGSAI